MTTRNARTHVLLTLGALFTIGGATRILPHPFAAAESNTPATEEVSEAVHPAATPAVVAAEPQTEPGQVCFTAETAAAMAEDQRRFEVAEQALQDQELELQVRQQRLDQQAAELQALQQSLEKRWGQMTASADADIEHLAEMYSAMKPDQAATIFNQMDPGFAAGFLRLMQSERAGMILASMDSSKAYVVSVRLASKNGDIRAAKTTNASAPASSAPPAAVPQ